MHHSASCFTTPVPHFTTHVLHFTTPVPHFTTPVPHFITPVPHFTTPVPHFTTPVPHFTKVKILHLMPNVYGPVCFMSYLWNDCVFVSYICPTLAK